jgi:cell shape-determining protein MreD
MVYASLGASLATMTSLAVLGGLLFDSLSFNPPGISIIPLFLAGSIIFSIRTIILREQFYARFVLGMTASAFVPALTMLMLLNTTRAPLIGWGTLWQWLVLTLGGGLLTPVVFWTLDLVQRALIYHPAAETSFRPDREIRRGRN